LVVSLRQSDRNSCRSHFGASIYPSDRIDPRLTPGLIVSFVIRDPSTTSNVTRFDPGEQSASVARRDDG
jgi:hypothetical protein